VSIVSRWVFALLVGAWSAAFVSQASAEVSEQRAKAIEKCSKMANSEYPDKNIYSMRSRHDVYASCMTNQGEVP
jgi:hypothetical protein